MQTLKDHMRDRIVKAATKNFRKYGFERAKMRQIAQDAGMTVGNLYRYYKNKRDLLEKIIADGQENPKIQNLDIMVRLEKPGALQIVIEQLTDEMRRYVRQVLLDRGF